MINRSVDNRKYVRDHLNIGFNYLHLDCDIHMVYRRSIYDIIGYYVDQLNRSLIVQWLIKTVTSFGNN